MNNYAKCDRFKYLRGIAFNYGSTITYHITKTSYQAFKGKAKLIEKNKLFFLNYSMDDWVRNKYSLYNWNIISTYKPINQALI